MALDDAGDVVFNQHKTEERLSTVLDADASCSPLVDSEAKTGTSEPLCSLPWLRPAMRRRHCCE